MAYNGDPNADMARLSAAQQPCRTCGTCPTCGSRPAAPVISSWPGRYGTDWTYRPQPSWGQTTATGDLKLITTDRTSE